MDRRIDTVLSPQDVRALPKVGRDYVHTYGYLSDGQWVLCGDDGRFVNHSWKPNSYTVRDASYAARVILPGEEITENYTDFIDPEGLVHFPFLRQSEHV